MLNDVDGNERKRENVPADASKKVKPSAATKIHSTNQLHNTNLYSSPDQIWRFGKLIDAKWLRIYVPRLCSKDTKIGLKTQQVINVSY